jgi:nitroimidazol reductase NimA-like FMN-containing flavoprotein (pyridoxamine 5'-phosphate oxidase superfamily)
MTAPSQRATVRRSERSAYDPETIHSILDEALIAHVGFVSEGAPVVLPMLHARIRDRLLLHGSPASSLTRALKRNPAVCVTVTIFDGLVLARSAFNSSANYRSVVVFGRAERITGLAERAAALDAFTDKVMPGRRPHIRPNHEDELKQTAVFAVPLDEASAKIRSGPPHDEDEDYELPIWAGEVPAAMVWGEPEPDPENLAGVPAPEHLDHYRP